MDINWVGPILGAIVGAVLLQLFNWLKSKRGDKVAIVLKSQTNEISVSERVRSSLEIRYKERTINQLVIHSLQISNEGDNDLKDISIKVQYAYLAQASTELFAIPELVDPLDRAEILHVEQNSFVIHRPFFNRIKAHKADKLELAIISNAKLSFSVSGGGQGWTAEYRDLANQKKPSILSYIYDFASGTAAILFISIVLMDIFNIVPNLYVTILGSLIVAVIIVIKVPGRRR